MIDSLQTRLSNEQLHQIINEGFIYMCACPAAVAKEMMKLRELYDYQRDCVSSGALMDQVHIRIAEATQLAHAEMERCLEAVLEMEGWDKTTLIMPEGLRQLRADIIDKELG